MKDISTNRLKLLFIRYFRENWKRDVMMMGIIAGIEMLTSQHPTTSEPSFTIINVFVMIYTASIFGMLSKRQQSINYLMIPASSKEKIITNICLSQIYYPIALFLASFIGIWASTFTNALIMNSELTFKSISMFAGCDFTDIVLKIVMFMMFNSIFMFGSVYFKRYALIKTLLWTGLGSIVLLFVFGISFKMAVAGSEHSIFDIIVAQASNATELYKTIEIATLSVMSVLVIFFWTISYTRLKETEA